MKENRLLHLRAGLESRQTRLIAGSCDRQAGFDAQDETSPQQQDSASHESSCKSQVNRESINYSKKVKEHFFFHS
jgi:hypothetical protein